MVKTFYCHHKHVLSFTQEACWDCEYPQEHYSGISCQKLHDFSFSYNTIKHIQQHCATKRALVYANSYT